ncbi:MAG TPA: HD domain-containing phosphohydrolase [Candidatus Methanoperedens sp.]|nr:HD domain-containing phosphohydrolase [Candidatus Methanoperedens sp.]
MAERLDEQSIHLGKRLVRAFFVLYKTAGNYAPGHPALAQPLAELAEIVAEFARRREEALLAYHDDTLFVGELRLKPDAAGFDAFLTTMRALKHCRIGSVAFTLQAEPAELAAWFGLFREIEARPSEDPCGALLARMAAADLAGIEVERPLERAAVPVAASTDAKERAKGLYAQTIEVVSEVMEHVKVGKALRLKRSKRVVQTMIDQLLAAESNLLGLTNLRCHDEYTYNHSVNVGILSIAIGQRVGLSKNRLVELGMAAIFHDIGKSCIPLEILNKPAAFDEREWATVRRHPVLGVKELLKLKGVDALTARIMQGAFEHHLHLDGTGYPRVGYPRGASLGGRIVAIADCYDALTSSRVYRRVADPPEVTLRYIVERSGTLYDPILAKLFVNALGLYPVGTLCQLSSGELAVVYRSNPDPELWEQPEVRIIAAPDGAAMDGETVNLAEPGAGRRIARTLDARANGIDVGRYFL